MQQRLPCDHRDTWGSHPPIPISVQGGALVVTVMYCTSCGHAEYRSPPINQSDEDALDERMKKVERKQRILQPLERHGK